MNKSLIFTALWLLLGSLHYHAAAQCSPDVTPPIAVCNEAINLFVPSGGTATFSTEDLNGGSFDACTPETLLDLRIGEMPIVSPVPSAISLTFTEADAGEQVVALYVLDEAGNLNTCWATVFVETENCLSDTEPPSAVCAELINLFVSAGGTVTLNATDINEGSFDNCTPETLLDLRIGELPIASPAPSTTSFTFTEADAGEHVVALYVLDQVGNANACLTTVFIETEACLSETEPPTAICKSDVVLEVSGGQTATISTWQVNDGSYDNCTPSAGLDLRLEVFSGGTTPPSTTEVSFGADDFGTHILALWVGDYAGNWSTCLSTVEVAPCTNGTISLACNDLVQVNIPIGETFQLGPFDVLDGGPYCSNYSIRMTPDDIFLPFLELDSDDLGPHLVTVRDNMTGNMCWANLQVTQYNCDQPDLQVPTPYCKNGLVIELMPVMPPLIQVWASDFDAGSFDNCPGALKFSFSSDDTDISRVFNCSDLGVQPITLFVTDEAGNQSFCETTINTQATQGQDCTGCPASGYGVQGSVFEDTETNCALDPNEQKLAGWQVQAIGNVTGEIYSAMTDANGFFLIEHICPEDTQVELHLGTSLNYGGASCATTWPVQPAQGSYPTQNIPVKLEKLCPLLEVDLSSPLMRRCFNNVYYVQYCNYSIYNVEDAHVEITLDPFMEYLSSSLPGTALGGNAYSFPVGDLEAGDCGQFSVFFNLSCDAMLGATHCVEAHIFPDSLCPITPQWTGANIEVEGTCEGGNVQLSIKNTGTGDMAAPLDFIVVQDVIMYMTNPFNLNATESYSLPPLAAAGSTWRLEAQQEPGHPYPGNVSVTLEGCDGINFTGLVNLFSVENPNPFIAVDCMENIGSYDPNDKQAFPTGYGEEHLIKASTDLEYLIRFQNTGTDTAFTVVVMDTLSPFLDPLSVRPGASSHPYTFELLDGTALRFRFDHILLPDSSTNEPASHGFIRFSAKQKPGNPLGSVIENEAAIYFDFNEPVITNTVFHTIGEHFVEVLADKEVGAGRLPIRVSPNPSAGDVWFEIPAPLPVGECSFRLLDQFGKTVRGEVFEGGRYRFERGTLAAGAYFYSIENEGLRLYSGKVMLK